MYTTGYRNYHPPQLYPPSGHSWTWETAACKPCRENECLHCHLQQASHPPLWSPSLRRISCSQSASAPVSCLYSTEFLGISQNPALSEAMVSYGKKTILLHADNDTPPKKIVLEDTGRPRKIIFEDENGDARRIVIEGDEDVDNLQTVVIRETKPKPSRTAVVAVAVVGVPALLWTGILGWINRPRDPTLSIKSITLSGFSLHTSTASMALATIDLDVTIYVMVRNPNVTPITFHATVMEIFYRGSRLGQAMLHPGDQRAQSEQMLELPCKMSGLEATHHLKDLLSDVYKREMVLHAKATVKGDIAVMKLRHHYEVYVQSEIVVDPLFLDVIDQRHRADINIRGVALPWILDK